MRTRVREMEIKRREQRLREEAKERGKTRKGAIHTTVNHAGSKLLKGFYKGKHGSKPTGDKDTTPLQEARKWYANYNPRQAAK